MTAKELLKMLNEASDTAEIKIVDGEITIIEQKPQDITKRIKTFEDAYQWCEENGYCHLTKEYEHVNTDRLMSADVIAYAKLRIITAALNEEWYPEEGTNHAYPIFFSTKNAFSFGSSNLDGYITNSKMLVFKTQELAKYAAKQFADIYADFCGFPKSWAKWKTTMDKLNK